MPNIQKTLQQAVRNILTALVRALIRNGMAYGDFDQIARKCFADVAFKEFAPSGKKQTVSNVAIITGLNRKEVKRMLELDEDQAEATNRQYNRSIRVIGGWINDPDYVRPDGIPKDRVRLHVCWGNYEGPHHHDAPMEMVLPIALRANVGALLFESSNPRHAHEWSVFADSDLPDDLILIPGVIDSTTNFIEHPKLVAERICRFADIVGRDRVIAGTDCGFSTFAGFGAVDEDIVFAKLESMAAGARIASERLWS